MEDIAVQSSDSSNDGLDDRQIAERLVYLGFVQPDADVLASLRPWAGTMSMTFSSSFTITSFPTASLSN